MDVRRIDFSQPTHCTALRELLLHYSVDAMGGGKPLSAHVLDALPARLRDWQGYVGLIAWQDDRAVGLLNAFTGFSTFAAQPLLNVHDLVVLESHRGQGIAGALIAAAENIARETGCCKVTLEVLSNNPPALAAYARAGFQPYQLDPAAGQALLMQKWLTPETDPS